MKRLIFIILSFIILSSCAPVLHHDLMSRGIMDMQPSDIRDNPELYRGRLFILGGIIVDTKAVEEGSMIEAIFVPVDSMGYLKDVRASRGRFLAIYPKDKGFLDPVIYKKNREITVAGEFLGIRTGKIEAMEYAYPFFEIKDIYLWDEREDYYFIGPPYPPYYYPPPYYGPRYYYDPWYSNSWWRYH